MTRRWPSIGVTTLCSLRAVAVLVCIALSVEGCSLSIADRERFGPNPEVALKAGSTRADVERMLGEPIFIETLPDGTVWAVYEYTTREGKSAQWCWTHNGSICGLFDYATLGVAEFVFMPLAYFAKDKHTYQKEFVYGTNGMVVESRPERDKSRLSQSGWAACAEEADRELPGVHAAEVWRTHVRQCVAEGDRDPQRPK